MALPVQLVDGLGTSRVACVTPFGQLVVAPLSYDESSFKMLDIIDTAYNFYKGKAGSRFVITGLRIKAGKGVSATVDADLIIYEAESEDTIVVDKILHEEAMTKGDNATLSLNLLVSEGKFVNVKTNDDDFFITIFGYYIKV